MNNNSLAKLICNECGEGASFLDSDFILWKFINGEWVGKKAIKDPNHKGHKYIWEQ